MAYQPLETSPESSRPVELYTIVLGAETFRYTSAEDDVTVNSVTYTALSLDRPAFAVGPDERTNTITLKVPATNVFARRYVNSVPGARAFVSVNRYQRDDVAEEEVTIFQGLVESVGFKRNVREAEITVLPIIAAVSRQIPRYKYSSQCNHVLYESSSCKADDTDPTFRFTGSVSVSSDNTITIPGLAAFGDGWFNGGYVETNTTPTDSRMILNQVGDVLTLHLPFSADQTSATLVVLAGCDHTIATCKSKFDNVINFGGFAFVPQKNVFQTGIT